MKSIVFYRDFQEYTGGHQKVADYFYHLKSSPEFLPHISFSDETHWNRTNPWLLEQQHRVDYVPSAYDYAFLAGTDWVPYLAAQRPHNQPIINLIQHVRHADQQQPMYAFLQQKAVRICVSPEVAQAITATGQVTGPVMTIENGIALPALHQPERHYDLFIFGPKNPAIARLLRDAVSDKNLKLAYVEHWLPRAELLQYFAASRAVLLLPSTTEGFYLPALEAMHYAELCIVPDCVGNRSFCEHHQNCLFPAYNVPALVAALEEALQLLQQPEQLNIFKQNSKQTLAYHSLARERAQFLDVMNQLDEIWASI